MPYYELNEDAINLSRKYIEEDIIPANKREDARHLAIAKIYEVDALISWNFKHLANLNKEKLVHIVNLKEGYNYPLRLTTPLEVMD